MSVSPELSSPCKLAVVVGTRNRLDVLKMCLGSLINKISASHVIVVIDAGSTDGTVEYLRGLENVVLVDDGKPIGQAQSLNKVFRELKSEYICWVSDDNEVMPGILDTAVSILDEQKQVGMVSLKVRDVLGPRTNIPYIGGVKNAGIKTCNQGVLRRELFHHYGFFDEVFKDYGIDVDLTAKILVSGHQVVSTRELAIKHYRDHDANPGAIQNEHRQMKKDRADKLFAAKYPYLIDISIMGRVRRFSKRILWLCIQGVSRSVIKKGWPTERIWDWYNVLNTRHIQMSDLFSDRSRPWYLVQDLGGRYTHEYDKFKTAHDKVS